jgi:hypothetical protein
MMKSSLHYTHTTPQQLQDRMWINDRVSNFRCDEREYVPVKHNRNQSSEEDFLSFRGCPLAVLRSGLQVRMRVCECRVLVGICIVMSGVN